MVFWERRIGALTVAAGLATGVYGAIVGWELTLAVVFVCLLLGGVSLLAAEPSQCEIERRREADRELFAVPEFDWGRHVFVVGADLDRDGRRRGG